MLLYSTPTSTTVNTSIVSVDTAKDTSSCAKNNDFFVDTVKNTSSFLYTEKNDATIDNINDTSSLVFTENNYPSIDTLNDVNFIKYLFQQYPKTIYHKFIDILIIDNKINLFNLASLIIVHNFNACAKALDDLLGEIAQLQQDISQ